MTRIAFILTLTALSSAAFATGAAGGTDPSWQEDIASQMAQADPDGGWEIAPVAPTPAAAKTQGLVAESQAHLAVDVSYSAVGAQTWTVTDLIVGVDSGWIGVEPDEL